MLKFANSNFIEFIKLATKKKLDKKLIVTVNLKGLSGPKFQSKVTAMATAAHNNPNVVPGLTPTPDDVLTMIGDRENLVLQREALRKSLKSVTEKIHKADTAIKDVITSKWANTVQNTIGTDVGKAKLLGFGIKGVDNGHSDDLVGKASESFPHFSEIEISGSLRHILHIRNNITGKAKLPPDAKHINIYQQIGGDEPTDISQMKYIGIATSGKYVADFKPEDKGKTVYYIAVYIDKKTLKPLVQGWVASAIVN